MVAEACGTLIREKHLASPPEWPEDIDSPAHVSQGWKGETETLREPPPVRRKTVSTPRPENERSPTKPEPSQSHSAWSPSPVVRPERPSALRALHPKTEESEDNGNGESGDEEQRNPLVRPASGQERDRRVAGRPGPGREPAMVTEPSADLALAILNGLDISSLPALQDLSTGASTMVRIPWPPARMEQATPEWRQRASEPMAFLLGS